MYYYVVECFSTCNNIRNSRKAIKVNIWPDLHLNIGIQDVEEGQMTDKLAY